MMADQQQPPGIVGESAFDVIPEVSVAAGGVDEVKDEKEEDGGDADDNQIVTAAEGDVFSLAYSLPVSSYTLEELASLERIFYGLYEDYSLQLGQKTSRQNRDRLGLTTPTLAYAEVSFDIILNQYNIMYQNGFSKTFGGKFYCIGAGMGKSTMAQLLLHDYDSVKGIEILSDLCAVCDEVRKKFNEIKSDNCSDRKVECSFQYLCADALSIDWSDADVAYIAATMFDEAIMKQITFTASKVKTGSFIICVSKELQSPLFDLISAKEIEASFGFTNIYIHRRNEEEHPTYLDDVEYLDRLGVFKKGIR